MNLLVDWGSSLISLAHDIFQPSICPGDWVWASIMAGFLVGLLPPLGAVLIALVRKGTGNTYNAATLTVFGLFGGVFAFLLPWLYTNGVSETFRTVFHNAEVNPNGDTSVGTGLTATEAGSMGKAFCNMDPQVSYMGGRANVYEVLFHPFESGPMLVLRYAMLLVVPGIAILFVWLQARLAFRRGPKWPGRFYWLPFVAALVLSVAVAVNVATYMWIGVLLASVLGLLPLLVVGPPSWSVIERRYKQAAAQQQPQQQGAQRPPPYVPPPQPPPYKPQPPAQPVRTPPPTRVAPRMPEPEPDRQALAALAADPGPLPFASEKPTAVIRPAGSRFQKLRQLGTGGFGTVWLAKDTQLNRTIAIKMAHAPDAETEERMLREARALAAVHHPNCVRVYDIVSEGDGLGLIMEYIEGEQLAEVVHGQGVLGDLQAARLWLTMAGALSAAHAKGVLHRDVKPANVIVDPEGMPHLIDFGIARSKGDQTLTAAGMMVGTPDFLAPETATGATATPASDAWQLAATVSFALAGHPPRGVRENAMAALMAAAKAEPLSHLPQRSTHLRLLAASLDKDPARRPTLAAIQREITAWIARAGQETAGPVTQIVPRAQINRR
ncbi:serine/threonine-protein kinase [Actinophytocola oryzae]|uniref:non-specific serine/threonine protein kinase n=1 Tax=Actinophytocola oryzae TaxID=502181 RepID=A0A4R7V933_9PSEU|nr:serine/threonine-protein kinase [Actinophytocola oryzae]TDV45417.1 serine/threonine protein kinase [Actinophytocola oryzae]